MFEVGFTEILVISVLALVVLGPEKLPRVAAQIGRWVGRARAMARQFREQLEDEVQLAETNKANKAKEASRAEADVAAAQSAAAPSASTAPGTNPDASAPYGENTQHMYSGVAGEHETHSAATSHDSHGSTPDSAATHAASETAHHADAHAPAPEPEATAYQPPAYATAGANGATSTEANAAEASASQPSAVQSQYTHDHEDPPLKPGEVMTHTHERGI
jgi:sec-independent protein translocase protein TatB